MHQDAHHIEAAATPLPAPLAGYTSYLLRRAFARANRMALESSLPEVDARDHVVLTFLSEQEAPSQQDLVERLGINRTIMVKLIDKLEAAGYVVRRRNPQNRRSYGLSLTQDGRAALAAMRPAITAGEKRLIAPLTRAEHRRLNELLYKLLPTLDPSSDARTGYLIAQAHHAMRRRHDEALADLGILTRHFGALAVLVDAEPCSQQQLAHQLGITEPAVVQIVDDLERLGLVSRERDTHDRRRYELRLTASGRPLLKAARRTIDEVHAEIGELLGDVGDRELRELLAKLLGTEEQAPPAG